VQNSLQVVVLRRVSFGGNLVVIQARFQAGASAQMNDRTDLRILVFAPDRDGELTCKILSRAGFECQRCVDEFQFERELARGAGVVICAEESLSDSVRFQLKNILESQPAWSDLPILIVAASGEHGGRLAALTSVRSVSVLSRPMAIDSLVTSVHSALRARSRQYEVRDLIDERDRAAQRKDDFLSMLAHELRNPLAPVRYGVQVLREQCPKDNADLTHAISLVDRQVAHMARLIEDLLDVSRLSRGAVALKIARHDLGRIQREVVEARQGIAHDKRITLQADLAAEPIWVDGDAIRLTQAIDNLVDNALKFSNAHGRVVVGARQEDGEAVLWVEDDGEGVEPSILAHLFEAFSQADRSLDREKGGLGLGLSIVHGIVALHGGSVTALSEGRGRGAKFVVRLPLSPKSESQITAAPSAATGAATGPLKVLIIEDNHASAELLRMMLSLYGHTVEVAHSGQEGMDTAERFGPDVLLCDIGLPGMSGYEVAEAMRSRAERPARRLVAITGYGDPENRRRALRAGFDAHLVKPVSAEDLLRALHPPADIPKPTPKKSVEKTL
jgi:signal transduction histidine kinase/ActR/RegA family two-component response regulator